MTQYFRTDGIRKPVNQYPMTAEGVFKLAQVTAYVLRKKKGTNTPLTALIGVDTRYSSPMFEEALQTGFTSLGVNCLHSGIVPTPAVGQLTRMLRADLGVMVTASHNPYTDNGLKLIGPDGSKLSSQVLSEIEILFDKKTVFKPTKPNGVSTAITDAAQHYISLCKASLLPPTEQSLKGVKLVLDCAHGATYTIAPQLFKEVGAEVIAINTAPNGKNINENCGSQAPAGLQNAVKSHKADLGIAFDGDGDRLLLVDETGSIINGDHLIAALAEHMHTKGALNGGKIALTVMNNLGLTYFLKTLGLGEIRTPVGDKYLTQAAQQHGLNLGGEACGHIILPDYNPISDACLAALHILFLLKEKGSKASSLRGLFKPYPQTLLNLPLKNSEEATNILSQTAVQQAVMQAQSDLAQKGRILLRPSGTEPCIRLMVEAQDQATVNSTIKHISSILEQFIK